MLFMMNKKIRIPLPTYSNEPLSLTDAQIQMFEQLEKMYERDGFIKQLEVQYPNGYQLPAVSKYRVISGLGLTLHGITKIRLHLLEELAASVVTGKTKQEIFTSPLIQNLSRDWRYHDSNRKYLEGKRYNFDYWSKYAGTAGSWIKQMPEWFCNYWLFLPPELWREQDDRDVLGQWCAGIFSNFDMDDQARDDTPELRARWYHSGE